MSNVAFMDRNPLTEREQELLKHYSKGLTHEQLAKKLKISTSTVSVHKFNIKAKLGIRSEFDLIRWCMKNICSDVK